MTANYLESVKRQYEALPYPPRDPADEARRLIQTVANNLLSINHHCYRGRRDFRSGFRCLVAGGGTGDAVVYLAEQLRDFDAEIVYLDLSEASRAVAEARVRRRGLANVRWITGSIMDIPKLGLGKFDYINCSGVLHHLESPEGGLAALNGVLSDEGAMGLMLYGKHARREVYDMQGLLREYLPPDLDIPQKVAMTRALLAALPATNSFKRVYPVWEWEISPEGFGDAGLYDLLLHSQDRCYDVTELYALADGQGLHVAGFPMRGDRYNPDNLVASPEVRRQLAGLPHRQRQALAEQISCTLRTHEFYLTRQPDTQATLDDEGNALLLYWSLLGKHREFAEQMTPGERFTYQDGDRTLSFVGNEITRLLLAGLDGTTPIRELYDRVQKALPGASREQARRELQNLVGFFGPQTYLYLLEAGSLGTRLPDYRRFRG
jgi:ubiquinone/menaquinone biosynthesis C-methylase UbiE